jgi:hypothetical protein
MDTNGPAEDWWDAHFERLFWCMRADQHSIFGALQPMASPYSGIVVFSEQSTSEILVEVSTDMRQAACLNSYLKAFSS